MKKGLCVSIFSFVLVFWVCSFTVFGLVEYEEKFVLTEETKVSDMISSMMYQLNPITTTDTLEYTIKLKLSTNTDRREFISSLQSQIIERLDAVCTITPSVKTSLYSDKVIFSVIKYVPTNNAYYNKLNTLVSEGSKLKTDVEKIYYLSNYFYNNGFKYAYDNEVEFGHIKSSSTYQNLNAMPDSVLERKKAICMGFANVGSEYLTALGIPNVKIRGHHIEDGGYHVWNVAYFEFNGKADWYCVDYGYSIYRANSPKVIKTLEGYVKEDKYVWKDGLLEDAKGIKYNKDLSLRNYSLVEKEEISLLEYGKSIYFLENRDWNKFLTSEELFNLSIYFTNIHKLPVK